MKYAHICIVTAKKEPGKGQVRAKEDCWVLEFISAHFSLKDLGEHEEEFCRTHFQISSLVMW